MTEPNNAPHPLLGAARAWYDAGYCVVPSHEDGGKRPFGRWKDYQHDRLPWDELETLLNTGRYSGIGVICGTASLNAEMIELEGPTDTAVEHLSRIIDYARELDRADGATYFTDLINTVTRGCVEKSAGGGLHFFIMVSDGPAIGNTKLAHTIDGKVIAETRGQGGFVITAPTTARNGHPDGATYAFARGTTPAGTPTITSEQRDILHLLFAHINEAIDNTPEPTKTPSSAPTHDGTSTFDAYRTTPWRDILEPLGWTWSHRDSERDYWIRPGKTKLEGISASTIEDGPLVNFSTNSGLPTERGLSKAQVYAHYHHGGDLTSAAIALRDQGYGDSTPRLAEFIIQDLEDTDDDPDPEAADQKELRRLALDRMVREQALKLLVSKKAKQLLARIELGNVAPLEGIDMAAFLAQEDEEEQYRIHGLWPAEGRVLLAAAAKAGKTTMVVGNLLPALVDGIPFLGNHATQPITRRIVVFNMEVGERTLRAWMRKAGITGTDRVVIVNLRGKASALQLATEEGRARLAEFLIAQDAEIVILDPLAPVLAALGIDENDNSQIAQFFSWWSEALGLAAVRDDLIVHHTGHAGDRSRGASRLLDEPDAIWTLKRDRPEEDEDTEFQPLERRYLTAYGRDVELAPAPLSFDPDTGRLRILDGTPEQIRAQERAERYYEAILAFVRDHDGATSDDVADGVRGNRKAVLAALRQMRDIGAIDWQKAGKSTLHFVRDTPDTPEGIL